MSSSELDSPSKTPLFIGIAAVIVALVGLGVGWMGLSRAAELEKQIARLEEAASQGTGLEESLQETADRVESLSTGMNNFSKSVNDAISGIRSDMTKVRSDIRKNSMDALTALKMVKDLEEKGVQVAVVPTASSSSSSSSTDAAAKKTPDTAPGTSGVYTIKSGDTLGKIAAAYKISLSQLQAANPGIDPRRLRIGQQVAIPAPSN
ncbi:LysM peptidoglycan-binding domain-containing protein [Pelagicoccus enzymogenes]|uniref:LysM peptidoglycan-binding domain-containing protein n=1 Tax=Pelagicoccus enzymogenes TaxID=2773457 RepID=UPI00280F9652|nr:LysM peptidoglycan-binding domain-containing protein [Pelagicoccus enzymogenes]MDQ8199637.1 LysM peptidoglycan-binding domain-containing protein [Pelagicoccus enzymogenes]